MKKAIDIQFFVLLVGTVFAWSNFFIELFDWLNKRACTTGCSASGQIANPFLTPCFYGAIFFLMAFILNLIIIFLNRKKIKGEAAKIEDKPSNSSQENLNN